MATSFPSPTSTTLFVILVLVCACAFAWGHQQTGGQKVRRNGLTIAIGWLIATFVITKIAAISPLAEIAPAVVFPLVIISTIVIALTGYGRKWAFGIPLFILTGLQTIRLPLELILHDWYIAGFMPVQMTYSGDNLDIITGILAIPATLLAVYLPKVRWPLVFFNLLGLWFLARIFIIVSLSSPTPLRSIFGGYSTGPEIPIGLYTPYSWLAFVVVAGAIFLHIASFRFLYSPTQKG